MTSLAGPSRPSQSGPFGPGWFGLVAIDALQAGTAAVLLLDFASGQLIATAAAGLEEEVRQVVRIPAGRVRGPDRR